MNTSTLASILMDKCKTIGVKFSGNSRTYTYKTTYDFKEEDYVIVPPPAGSLGDVGKPKVVEVVRVDEVPQLDPNASFEYKWVVQKVDMTDYNQLVSLENTVSDELKIMEQETLRKKTKELLSESLGVTPAKLNKVLNRLNKA